MYSCLSNQLALLMMLEARGEITTRELSLSLGITERAVHRILKDLADHGVISISKRGYRNCYAVHADRPAGHPAFPWLTLADLLGPIRTRLELDAATNGAATNGTAKREMALAV